MDLSGNLGQHTPKFSWEVKFYIPSTADPSAPTRKKLQTFSMWERLCYPVESSPPSHKMELSMMKGK